MQYAWLEVEHESIEAYEREAQRIFRQMIGVQRDAICL